MADLIDAQEETIAGLTRRLERNYISGTNHPSKYVTWSFSEDVAKIYAYLDSKHISGEKDSLGRDKPFFNIVLANRNIWFRATDLDRKNIKFKATKQSEVITQFVATAFLQDWMRRENFGQFLNDWGLTQAGFNEAIVEFVEQDGRLIPSVLSWNKTICDTISFVDNPVIKVLELTKAQLKKNKLYDKTQITKLFDAVRTRQNLQKENVDTNNAQYIKVYEIHGEFSQAVYNKAKGLKVKESDGDIYFQQIHALSFVAKDDQGADYDDFTLYCGKENNPHMLTALLPEPDGSIALRGSVKVQFDAQWMVNHSVKAIKDQLDLASKLIFQTADGTFVGQNALFAIESGDILIHAPNTPLTQIQNNSHDTTQLTEYGSMWKSVGRENAGISEAMVEAPKSGTAWRQTRAQLDEAHGLFDVMTQNRGLSVEQMLRRFVIPFLKKQMKHGNEITAMLQDYGIEKIDAMYINSEAIKKMMADDINAVLNGQQPKQDLNGAKQAIQAQMSIQGSQRFLKPSDIKSKTWADLFDNFEWEIECDITGENTPDREDLQTLTEVLNTISNNPRVLMDPNAKLIFNRILMIAGGISPMQLADAQPYVIPPQKRFNQTLDYADASPAIKRQMEAELGFQPDTTDQQTNVAPTGGSVPDVNAIKQIIRKK